MDRTEYHAGCVFKHCGTFQLDGDIVGHVFEAVSS
jgi:hypothetical protein